VPSQLHYRLVARAFGAPIASSYGSTEAGYVFMECEYGALHQVSECVHVDFIPFSAGHGGPRVGQMLVTTFGNPWRALVRFDIGDLARLAAGSCACGRTEGLTLASIEGRALNLTRTPDGRAVTLGEVDRAVAGVRGLAEYQLTQVDDADYHLAAVVEQAPYAEVRDALQEALSQVYGHHARFTVERVDAIAPDPPGKYKLVKSVKSIPTDALLDPLYAPRPLED